MLKLHEVYGWRCSWRRLVCQADNRIGHQSTAYIQRVSCPGRIEDVQNGYTQASCSKTEKLFAFLGCTVYGHLHGNFPAEWLRTGHHSFRDPAGGSTVTALCDLHLLSLLLGQIAGSRHDLHLVRLLRVLINRWLPLGLEDESVNVWIWISWTS